MLYIADLKKDGLLKIGVAGWQRIDRREAELRRKLKAPRLWMTCKTVVPHGWGGELDWEARLISRIRRDVGTLELFSHDLDSNEVVDGTHKQALEILTQMRGETEIDHALDADQLKSNREDWRFYDFWYPRRGYRTIYGANHTTTEWNNLIYRQMFINWLRENELARIPERLLNA